MGLIKIPGLECQLSPLRLWEAVHPDQDALKSLDAMKQLGIQTHLRSKHVDESTIAEPCLPR
jgi:hypothetical protein